ncbi:MAG: FAD-dependent oxidoreductase [Oscillospiraceae bacterium]|nr:FAD-dependent oxidoreductase [Oscillospiraceae bacterium]
MYDIIVIGGGPAGLTAAIYARRANKSVVVIEKQTFGGQITFSPKVENIPGFSSVTGNEFAEKLVEQAIEQGAVFEFCEATEIINGDIKTVVTDSGSFEGKSVIIATGAKHRRLGLDKEDGFVGEGISFCAVCDGAFFKDGTVAVIGGGNSALQEALQLSLLAKKVYVVQNLDFLTGEAALAKQVEAKSNIEVILSSTVKEILGDDTFKGITITSNGNDTELLLDGMFVAIGLVPQNENFANVLTLNKFGYADYNEDCVTENKGIYIAGDCRKKEIRQVTTAAADGAVAALAACKYLDTI